MQKFFIVFLSLISIFSVTAQNEEAETPKHSFEGNYDWEQHMVIAERKRDDAGMLLPLQSYKETVLRGMSFLLDDHLEWFKGSKEDKIDVIQVVLSLMNRESQQLIEELQNYPIGIFGRECLANGFLSGAIQKDSVFSEGTLNARYTRAEIAERVNQVEAFKFLLHHDISNMPQAALRWVLNQKGISTVLSGAKNIAELQGDVSASDAKPFTAEELRLAKELLKKDFEAA